MLAHAQGDRGGSRRTLSGSSRRVHIFTTAEVCGAHGASRRDLWCVSCEGLESGFAMPDTWRCIQLEGTYGRGAQIPRRVRTQIPSRTRQWSGLPKASARASLPLSAAARRGRSAHVSPRVGEKKTGAEPIGARAAQKMCTRDGRTLQCPSAWGPLAPLLLEYVLLQSRAGWMR